MWCRLDQKAGALVHRPTVILVVRHVLVSYHLRRCSRFSSRGSEPFVKHVNFCFLILVQKSGTSTYLVLSLILGGLVSGSVRSGDFGPKLETKDLFSTRRKIDHIMPKSY